MTSLRSAAVLLCAAALAACGDDAVQDITAPVPGARIKFFNFAVNGPGVNFYANDRKMTAISSATGTESTVGTNYGGVGAGGLYVGIDPGQYTLSGRISAAADKDLPIGSASATIAEGKSYSFYLSGLYDAANKRADAFVVEDDFPEEIDHEGVSIRFVNAIHNSQPMALYIRNPTTGSEGIVGSAVPYKGATPFVRFPGGGVVDIVARAPGSATALITRTAVSFVPGRVYTVTARGDMTVTSTTATNRPFLDNTANR